LSLAPAARCDCLSPDADGVLAPLPALPDVPEGAPEALPVALESGFRSWVADGELCAPSFFSCATAPNDNMAAATAIGTTFNFMEISFPEY
jgi:hypothetical protein